MVTINNIEYKVIQIKPGKALLKNLKTNQQAWMDVKLTPIS